jgi:hypothetical protein
MSVKSFNWLILDMAWSNRQLEAPFSTGLMYSEYYSRLREPLPVLVYDRSYDGPVESIVNASFKRGTRTGYSFISRVPFINIQAHTYSIALYPRLYNAAGVEERVEQIVQQQHL